MNLTINPDGTVSGPGFSPIENLVATHRFHIGIHLLAAKNICDTDQKEIYQGELTNHAREINRRFAIVSGLIFALGVAYSENKFDAMLRRLEITEDELNELAQNASGTKPSYGTPDLN